MKQIRYCESVNEKENAYAEAEKNRNVNENEGIVSEMKKEKPGKAETMPKKSTEIIDVYING